MISSGFPPSYLNPHSVASCSKGDWLLLQLHFSVTPTIAFTISCKFSCCVFSLSEGNPSFQNVFNRVVKSLGHRLSKRPSEATRHRSPGITSSKSERPLAGYIYREIHTFTLSAPFPTWKGKLKLWHCLGVKSWIHHSLTSLNGLPVSFSRCCSYRRTYRPLSPML